MHSWRSLNGPSLRELRLIEAEWPLIAAEIAVVDAEIALAVTDDTASDLGRRRLDQAVTGAIELRHLMGAELGNWLTGGPLGGAA